MNFYPIASSSAGNAYLLDNGTSRLLIECGVSFRHLQKALHYTTHQLCGCLISHEHRDHSRCCRELLKHGIPVWTSAGTAAALNGSSLSILPGGKDPSGEVFYQCVQIASFDVLPFAVFHDAAEPVGFLIQSRTDQERLLFATDTVNLNVTANRLNFVAIECNYREELLQNNSSLPPSVTRRIRCSHMEVKRTCAFLKKLDLRDCRHIYLLHLSDACSNETEMIHLVQHACPGIPVSACPKK